MCVKNNTALAENDTVIATNDTRTCKSPTHLPTNPQQAPALLTATTGLITVTARIASIPGRDHDVSDGIIQPPDMVDDLNDRLVFPDDVLVLFERGHGQPHRKRNHVNTREFAPVVVLAQGMP